MKHDEANTQGFDDSPPRNDIIFGVAAASLVILVGLKFGLDSYYLARTEEEVHVKVLTRGGEQLAAARAEELAKLHRGDVPIEQAMRALAQEGRTGIPVIAPRASDEIDALKGWSFHPEFEARTAAVGGAGVAAPDETSETAAGEASKEALEAAGAGQAAGASQAEGDGAAEVRPGGTDQAATLGGEHADEQASPQDEGAAEQAAPQAH